MHLLRTIKEDSGKKLEGFILAADDDEEGPPSSSSPHASLQEIRHDVRQRLAVVGTSLVQNEQDRTGDGDQSPVEHAGAQQVCREIIESGTCGTVLGLGAALAGTNRN
jgi:hypothetical protein